MVGGKPPRHSSALPPPAPCEAAPKGISGRTSYLRVRLAFHLYPQLIQQFCNTGRFGPPSPFRETSPWPWVAHPVSGLPRATRRPLRTRLRCGSGCRCLSLAARDLSPVRSTKSTPSQVALLRRIAGARFQALFHSPLPGCFSPFPRGTLRYRSCRVFSLGTWSSLLPAGFLVSRGTQVQEQASVHPSPTGLSPSSAALPRVTRLSLRVALGSPSHPDLSLTTPTPHRQTDH